MPTNKLPLKACVMLLLSMVVGCGDDGVTPPDTSDTTPPANVADLANPSSTALSATLTWTAPGDDGTAGRAVHYDIRYSTAVITAATFSLANQTANVPAPSAAGTGETFTVTGLTANTTYYFALKTADEVPNWSALSNVTSATTQPEATPPAAVTDLLTTANTASSVTLNWTAPGDDGTVGTAAQYDIRYSISIITNADFNSATQAANLPVPSTAGTGETFTVTGLTENTTYFFALKTADEVPNWSGLSNVANATTPPAPLPQFVLKWGSFGSGDGQFNLPKDIAVDGSGNVYVADGSNARIQKFDGTGTFLTKWGSQGPGDGQFGQPRGIAVEGSGNVYVADWRSDGYTLYYRIQKFDGTGTFLTKWGSFGSGDGQFDLPFGIAVDGSGNVYVADHSNHRIQKFDGTGTFLTKWGSQGTGDGQFNFPVGVAVDGSRNVYVTDWLNNRIQKFDGTGAFATKWGSQGTGDGQFNRPFGIAVDGSRNVYVVDNRNHRIQKFK